MRILVVEDDTTTALLLEKALRRMGHDVTVASGGGPAWELYARDPFPVVVTDWEMPEVDGLELTKRVRHARSRSYTWVIMLTAREADHHMDKAVESGVDDFLQKPLDLRLLAVRLKVAERVVAMGAQVAALASAVPMCMHCNKVKDVGDSWRKIEYYLAESGVDLTHGYCPDCYYSYSLLPELQRWRRQVPVPGPNGGLLIDPAVFDSLTAFERESPSLVADVVAGVIATAPNALADLKHYHPGRLGGPRQRLEQFRSRLLDVGAGQAAAAFDEVLELDGEDLSAEVTNVLANASEKLTATLVALEKVPTRFR